MGNHGLEFQKAARAVDFVQMDADIPAPIDQPPLADDRSECPAPPSMRQAGPGRRPLRPADNRSPSPRPDRPDRTKSIEPIGLRFRATSAGHAGSGSKCRTAFAIRRADRPAIRPRPERPPDSAAAPSTRYSAAVRSRFGILFGCVVLKSLGLSAGDRKSKPSRDLMLPDDSPEKPRGNIDNVLDIRGGCHANMV